MGGGEGTWEESRAAVRGSGRSMRKRELAVRLLWQTWRETFSVDLDIFGACEECRKEGGAMVVVCHDCRYGVLQLRGGFHLDTEDDGVSAEDVDGGITLEDGLEGVLHLEQVVIRGEDPISVSHDFSWGILWGALAETNLLHSLNLDRLQILPCTHLKSKPKRRSSRDEAPQEGTLADGGERGLDAKAVLAAARSKWEEKGRMQ